MSLISRLLVILVAVLAGCSTMRSQNFQTPMIDVRDVRALFVGDSITANWSQAAQARNAGISGATTEMAGRRFADEIKQGSPRYVHIMAGTNDIYGLGKWDASTVSSVTTMVSAARARNIPVIVGTIPPLDQLKYPSLAAQVAPYNTALVAEVKPLGAFIADYYAAMVLPGGVQNATLFSDGVHPNEAGYKVMNKVLRETKREMWSTIYTPEQRQAWREQRREKWKNATPEARAAWKARREGKT